MYKKRLLSYTATATVLLFNIQFNSYAETLEVPAGKQPDVSEKNYEMIQSKTGGQIIGKHLNVVGNKTTNTSENINIYVVTAEGTNSAITLQDDTTIKGKDSVISFGVKAKDGATFQMTGGTLTVSDTGALFGNNNNKEANQKM